MSYTCMRRCLACAALLAVVTMPAALAPQAQVSTSSHSAGPDDHDGISLSGTVRDPSSAIVVGARLTLRLSGKNEFVTATTNPAGEFRFDEIPPGQYDLNVEYPSFKVYKARLKVGSHAPAPLRIILAIGDVQETIWVKSTDNHVNAGAANNMNVTVLNPGLLENLPLLDRDATAILSRLLDPAAVGSRGASVVVDGMEGYGQGIPVSEIQEVKINKNPYSAEFARPGRGRIEIITKSGSSKYHGSFYFGFRDYRLDARNAFAVERPPEQLRNFEGNFSGPLGKSRKNSFSLSARRSEDDLQSVIYALGSAGPIRENAAKPQTTTYFSGQMTRRVDKNALSFRYSMFDWSDRGEGVGGFNLPEVALDSTSRYYQFDSSYRVVISANLLNEFLARLRTENSSTRSRRPGVPKIVVLDAFTSGGGQSDASATDNRAQLTDILSWSRGNHFVKTGINIPAVSRLDSVERSNFDGTFRFYSVDDFAHARPFSFEQQGGDPRLIFWQEELGLFAQDEIRIRPNLSVALGLRYDWQSHVPSRNNFAPRLAYAFSPDKSQNTVFRGGAGFFYDTMPSGAITDALRFNGIGLHQVLLLNPGYPNPLSSSGSFFTLPAKLVRFAPGLHLPYIVQYSFGIERQIRRELTLSASYVGTEGIKLFRSRDVNAPLPPLYLARPDPSRGVIRQIESSGRLQTNALEITLRGDLGRLFGGMVVYKLQRAKNDTDGINAFPANNWDLRGEWSRASFDAQHFFYVYGTLNLAKFFNLGIIFSANSGRPYSLLTGHDDNHDGLANDRPPGVSRNTLLGPGSATLDLRLSREFFLQRSKRGKKEKGPSLTAGLDAFNVLNQVNYSSYVGNLGSPFFGHAVSAGPARRLQASLSFKF